MRIDPVYLVAPPPKLPSMPTRRALLLAGASFVVGTGLGGACGYAMGAKATGGDTPADASGKPVDEPLVSTGDADLDELRRLAVKAPIAELMENAPMFVTVLDDTYPKDKVLWQGLERICDALLGGSEVPDRRVLSRVVAQQIENGDPILAAGLKARAAELRQLK